LKRRDRGQQAQEERPEEERAVEAGPHARELEAQGQVPLRVAVDVVVVVEASDEAVAEARGGPPDEDEEDEDTRPRRDDEAPRPEEDGRERGREDGDTEDE